MTISAGNPKDGLSVSLAEQVRGEGCPSAGRCVEADSDAPEAGVSRRPVRRWLAVVAALVLLGLLADPIRQAETAGHSTAMRVAPTGRLFTYLDSLHAVMPRDDVQPPGSPCARAVRRPGWLAAENAKPGATGWSVPPADPDGVVGYVDSMSARCGDVVRIRLSGPGGRVHVLAYRLGWYHGAGARLVWDSPPVLVRPHTSLVSAGMPYTVTEPWPVSLEVRLTWAWQPGVYLLVPEPLHGPPGQAIPLVVRDDAGHEPLLVKLSTFTWAAYNTFGGRSLYTGRSVSGNLAAALATRSREVSLRRPLAGAGFDQMTIDALPLVPFVERLGLDVAYITDLDLDEQPSRLLQHGALVCDGHSEYWTSRMLDAATAARNAGVNLAFLGANNVYWRARLRPTPDDGPHLVVYKDFTQDPVTATHPDDATVRWQSRPLDRDESSLLGQTSAAILVRGSFVMLHTPTWLTGGFLRPGDVLPDSVGNEADAQATGRPYPPSDETMAVALLAGPRGIVRVATMNYSTTPSGAGVFAAGTTYWVCDLSDICPLFTTPPVTMHAVWLMTERLLRAFATARAGARYPSVLTPPVTAAQVLARYPDAPVGYYAADDRPDRRLGATAVTD